MIILIWFLTMLKIIIYWATLMVRRVITWIKGSSHKVLTWICAGRPRCGDHCRIGRSEAYNLNSWMFSITNLNIKLYTIVNDILWKCIIIRKKTNFKKKKNMRLVILLSNQIMYWKVVITHVILYISMV